VNLKRALRVDYGYLFNLISLEINNKVKREQLWTWKRNGRGQLEKLKL